MANGYIPSGARGGFPVQVRTISTMIGTGRRQINPGRAALVEGYVSARGPRDVVKPDCLPGSGQYCCQQRQMLMGTDIRNFNRSSRAKTGKVR